MHMQMPRNMTLNRQRNDRPMIKIYKDLMVTKRDLIDLRESITNTIKSIKEADRGSKEPRGKCNQCGDRLNPAEGHECKQTVKCELCLMQFQGVERLN